MTKDQIIEYLYDINVKADVKIEDIADELSKSEGVVRCKDCKYNPKICFIGCPVDVPVDDDFFCAKGKRRNE